MTTDELKQKIIDKVEVMLESERTCEELSYLADVYNKLTANECIKAIGEKVMQKTSETPTDPFKSGFAFPPSISCTTEVTETID